MESNIIESNLLPLKDGSGLIDAEFHKSVGPEHAASVVEQVVSPEEFFAEGTTPLADTTPAPKLTLEKILGDIKKFPSIEPIAGLYNQREPIKVDGDRTQMTEAQMSGVVGEVLDQTVTSFRSSVGAYPYIEAARKEKEALYTRVQALEEQNKKIIAALKHLGLDTNKHFR